MHEASLCLELAFFVDSGKCLCNLCYLSEGDDLLSPTVYDRIMTGASVMNAIFQRVENGVPLPVPMFANLCAIARRYSEQTVCQSQL